MPARADELLTFWFGPSYRTNLLGAAVVLASILNLLGPDIGITPDLQQKIAQIITMLGGGGLMFARDNRVSSERAGAK